MKHKIAMYIEPTATNLENARPLGEWAENYPESYIRVTEFVDVEFPMLRDHTEQQIKALRMKQDELEAETKQKLEQIEGLISTLLSIEYQPDS